MFVFVRILSVCSVVRSGGNRVDSCKTSGEGSERAIRYWEWWVEGDRRAPTEVKLVSPVAARSALIEQGQ